jgi:hypothetical protein
MAAPSSSWDACVVAAPGDGIAPALLLTVGGEDRGVQVREAKEVCMRHV